MHYTRMANDPTTHPVQAQLIKVRPRATSALPQNPLMNSLQRPAGMMPQRMPSGKPLTPQLGGQMPMQGQINQQQKVR
jgi:hypothetical protein